MPCAATLQFNEALTTSDPQSHPVLIVGQLRHLSTLRFDHVRQKLEPRVTAETFERAVASLHPSPTDFCPLFLNVATVVALPIQCSRHNTSSRAHALTRLVRTHAFTVTESIVVVCDRADLFASACAVARAFPLYSRKSSRNPPSNGAGEPAIVEEIVVNVEFIIIENESVSDARLTTDEMAVMRDAAFGIRLSARIVDMPCNEMNVSHFIGEIETVVKELGATGVPVPKVTVIRGEELRAQGFGGIYGVGRAAECPPALVIVSHVVDEATETVAWVGKGIVYDTGGLSIKGKTAMPGMKRDCGGAAAILGALFAALRAGFNQNLHAVFCLAENSVGSKATRPDDIHCLYSGRTVEINNTDAEGRLVLADGVAYAKRDLKATIILDMATLTGAQGIATGKYHGAVLTNTEKWEQLCVDAGKASGDLLAPIVYCPDLHFSEFASTLADMKNSVADRSNALASCAGLFIGANLGFDFPGVWIHVDMAYPVHTGERATGYGVALLCTLFGKFTRSSLLKSVAPTGTV